MKSTMCEHTSRTLSTGHAAVYLHLRFEAFYVVQMDCNRLNPNKTLCSIRHYYIHIVQGVEQTGDSSSSRQDIWQDGMQSDVDSSDASSKNEKQLDYTTLNSKERKRLASTSPLAPIWTVPAQPIFFYADRPSAKELAKSLTALSFEQLLHV